MGSLDVLPQTRNRCPETLPDCYNSAAAFFSVVSPAAVNYSVHFSAEVPPLNLRFNLLNAAEHEKLLVHLYWNSSSVAPEVCQPRSLCVCQLGHVCIPNP